jgi:hypothetical protein
LVTRPFSPLGSKRRYATVAGERSIFNAGAVPWPSLGFEELAKVSATGVNV